MGHDQNVVRTHETVSLSLVGEILRKLAQERQDEGGPVQLLLLRFLAVVDLAQDLQGECLAAGHDADLGHRQVAGGDCSLVIRAHCGMQPDPARPLLQLDAHGRRLLAPVEGEAVERRWQTSVGGGLPVSPEVEVDGDDRHDDDGGHGEEGGHAQQVVDDALFPEV